MRMRYCEICEDQTPSLGDSLHTDVIEFHRSVHYLIDLTFFGPLIKLLRMERPCFCLEQPMEATSTD